MGHALDKPSNNGIGSVYENDRNSIGSLLEHPNHRAAYREYHVGRERNQFLCVAMSAVDFAPNLTDFDLEIAAYHPSKLLQILLEQRDPCLRFRIIRSERGKHANVTHALQLLRTCRKRPHPGRRSGEKRDELASSHSPASLRTVLLLAEASTENRTSVRFGSNSEVAGPIRMSVLPSGADDA